MGSVYLGLDLGKHRTGAAVSASGMAVRALPALRNPTPHLHVLIEQIITLVREHQVDMLIIGDPRSEDGSSNPQSDWVLQTTAAIQKACSLLPWTITCQLVDEYQSTQHSQKLLPGADRDSAAAALILANHLGIEI